MSGKRVLSAALCLGLIGGALAAPAQAKKKKKPKAPVQVDQKMFLVGDGCVADDRGLSLTDTADVHTCAYFKGGVIGDTAPESAPGGALWQTWPALDGVPLKLDTSSPSRARSLPRDCSRSSATTPAFRRAS